ncbi:MAG: hypothetical protein AB7C89_01395 [Intestinibacillus sp.]
MQRTHRFISLTLTLAFVLATTSSALENVTPSDETLSTSAIERIIDNSDSKVTANEYDLLVQAKEEAERTLKNSKSAKADLTKAQEILDYDPAERVQKLQSFSEEELRNLGFSEERIDIIKNFTGTEKELRALSANVTGALSTTTSRVSGVPWVRATYYFNWDGPIAFDTSYDVAQIGATHDFMFRTVSNNYCTLNYSAYGATGSTDYSKAATVQLMPKTQGYIGGASFSATEYKSGNTYYVRSGSISCSFSNANKSSNQSNIEGSYLHSTLIITQSAAINFSLNLIKGIINGINMVIDYTINLTTGVVDIGVSSKNVVIS